MRYLLLGRSGLRVSELCLGTMTFGEDWGWGSNKDESRRVFEAFAEAGGNFLDTANLYTNGTSERMLGEFLAGRRERFVITTKYTLNMQADDPNAGGNHRKNMVQSLEASLKRLGVDYIDLYLIHAWDFITPVDEIMRSLDDAVRAGKVLYVGVSDAPAYAVARANTLAELRGWAPFVALQIPYSLIERTPERELIPMAAEMGLTVTPWAPLGGGVLTGKYRGDRTGARYAGDNAWSDTYLTERNLAIGDAVCQLASEIGRSPAQVALNWLRQRPLAAMIPIIGARRLDQLQDNLACLQWRLSDEHVRRLDEVSKVDMGFPMSFLGHPVPRKLIFGNNYENIDRRSRAA
jgi:aryl-alcohol dehydrogenase-like predicted oxidoreductase